MSDPSVAVLAMVLLGNGQRVDPSAVEAAWRELWPDVAPIECVSAHEGGLTFSCTINGEQAGVGVIPTRVPESDLAGPATTSWLWPNATEDLLAHDTHALVFLRSTGSPESAHIDSTRLVAAVVRGSGALGVYVGEATMVIRGDVFVDTAKRLDPLLADQLWIDFRCLEHEDGSTSLFTVGLDAFGSMELEVDRSRHPCGEVRNFTIMIAGYLTANGPVLKDGDTVGGSEDQRIQVRHHESIIDRDGPVMRLVGF